MSLDEIIDAYFWAKADIHEAFGYKSDWVEIPLEDRREKHWMLVGGEGEGGRVVWSDSEFTRDSIAKGDEIFSGTVYTQRFLSKYVFRIDKHVLVSTDMHTDGNKFLMIFDSDKECVDDAMRSLYAEHW